MLIQVPESIGCKVSVIKLSGNMYQYSRLIAPFHQQPFSAGIAPFWYYYTLVSQLLEIKTTCTYQDTAKS